MPEAATIALVFRYDDFFSPEPNLRPVAALRRVEQGLASLHARTGIPAVFAAVPAGLGDTADDRAVTAAVVRACRAGSEVALHGYNHLNTLKSFGTVLARAWARFCQRTRSEFAGLPLEDQVRRISEGRAVLEDHFGQPVTTFIPPWNAYDRNTIEACRRSGLRTLSASRAWPVPGSRGMAMIPQTVGADRLEEAVEFALRRARPAAVVCVTHVWDFTDHEEDGCIPLPSWEARMRRLNDDPRIVVTTVNRMHQSAGTLLTANRMRRHRMVSAMLRVAAQIGPRTLSEVRRASYPLD